MPSAKAPHLLVGWEGGAQSWREGAKETWQLGRLAERDRVCAAGRQAYSSLGKSEM